MDKERDGVILLRPDPVLSVADLAVIASRLMTSGALTPGFIAPEAGLLSLPSMF